MPDISMSKQYRDPSELDPELNQLLIERKLHRRAIQELQEELDNIELRLKNKFFVGGEEDIDSWIAQNFRPNTF